MSGGSFDYLCQTSATDLFTWKERDSLREMIAGLRRLGHDDAAQATQSLLTTIEIAVGRVEKEANALRAIWKAAEWNRSGDWNEGDVKEAVDAWRGPAKGES